MAKNKQTNNTSDNVDISKSASDVNLKKIAEKDKKTSNKNVRSKTAKIKLNTVSANTRKGKESVKAIAKAATLYTIAYLLNKQLQNLSKKTQQLSMLVDKVNNQINSIQTKQDVLKARVTKNAAIVTLNSAEAQVTSVKNTIKTLENISKTISTILKILSLIPIPPFTPLKITQKITNVILTLDAITLLLVIDRFALERLIVEIQYQKSRLLPISDIIDKAIDKNLTIDEINNLLNRTDNLGTLGPLEGVIYRGFTFAIFEEDDPKFVVAGNKRRYAVAYDRSGFIRLKSDASFTLDPKVLVSELKLIIDEQNLEP